MYSKYSGISIPQNYGGSRFRVSEPPMKTHRAESSGASKSAHSPSFVQTKASPSITTHSNEYNAPIEEEFVDECELEGENLGISLPSDSDESAKDFSTEEANDSEECSTRGRLFDFSSFKDILSGLDKDSILILGLILLFMSDSDNKNDDIIPLLALLLLG